jgi:hypothetical protein
MSATNIGTTGHVRHPDDFYETPSWATLAILHRLERVESILDPCCGRGAILDTVQSLWPGAYCRGIEIDESRANIANRRGHNVHLRDALSDEAWPSTSLVLTNPPFSLAMPIIQRALRECPRVDKAFLLRLDFLATVGRAAFHRTHPSDVHVLPRRPAFCASITCIGPKGSKSGCGWHVTQEVDAPRPAKCSGCGDRLRVTTTDSSEYAWFVWGPARGGRWAILEVSE